MPKSKKKLKKENNRLKKALRKIHRYFAYMEEEYGTRESSVFDTKQEFIHYKEIAEKALNS